MHKYITHLKKLIVIAIPIVVAEAGSQLAHTIDSMMVGQLGALYLAASSLANYVFIVPMLFGMGFFVVLTSFVGNANGAKDMKECKKLFHNGVFLQIFVGILLTALVYFIGFLIPLISSDLEKTNVTLSYYNWIVVSTFPLVIFFGLKCYIDGFGHTIYGMIGVLISSVSNIFLNWLLIFGNWGFPEMGIVGAGIATALCRFIGMIYMIIVIIFVPKLNVLVAFPNFKEVTKEYFKKLLKNGSLIGVQMGFEIAAFSLIVIFVG